MLSDKEYEFYEKGVNSFLQQYPLIPYRMKTASWHMPGLFGHDSIYEYQNRYGLGAKLSIRQGIIVQIDHIRRHQKKIIDVKMGDERDNIWNPAYDEMWCSVASAMARLFLLNRFKMADRIYRYMEDLCKKI